MLNNIKYILLSAAVVLCSVLSPAQNVKYPVYRTAGADRNRTMYSAPAYSGAEQQGSQYTPAYGTASGYDRQQGVDMGLSYPPFLTTSPYRGQVQIGGRVDTCFVMADDFIDGGNAMRNGPRKLSGSFWDDPDEDDYGIGVVPNPAPVGSPLVLLLMACVYVVCLALRRHRRQEP